MKQFDKFSKKYRRTSSKGETVHVYHFCSRKSAKLTSPYIIDGKTIKLISPQNWQETVDVVVDVVAILNADALLIKTS
jgi:hypothetical protein